MPEPYIQIFTLSTEEGGLTEIASIVMDKTEFDELLDKAGLSEKDKKHLKANEHIPLIMRGTQTEWIFEQYGIQTQLITIIVRKAGEKILTRYMENLIQRN